MSNTYNQNITTITLPDDYDLSTSTISITGNGNTYGSLLNSNYTVTSSNGYYGGYTSASTAAMTVGTNVVSIDEKATLEVKGNIKLNGECLNERLERIETLLHIPVRDIEMETKHPRLKELWEEYNRTLAKYKTWDALKESK